jgi:hypothetical protein
MPSSNTKIQDKHELSPAFTHIILAYQHLKKKHYKIFIQIMKCAEKQIRRNYDKMIVNIQKSK